MDLTNGHIEYESSYAPNMMKSDPALVKSISLGDTEALEVLMDRYLPMVSRVSYRILCDIRESEAVTAEVFLKVWGSAGEYDFRHGVSVWIYRMICNLCYIHLRRIRFLDLLSIHLPVYETSAPQPLSPEEDFMTKETWGIYCRASGFLTAKQRAVFVLRELEGLSTEEVAAIMDMRSDRIRDNLLAARGKIKEELAKYGKVI